MEMYTIKDLVANKMVAVIDGTEMSMEDAFDYMRKENKELTEQRDSAVRCVEMFIKSLKCCTLCANMACKLNNQRSKCSPIWSGDIDAEVG